MWRDALVVAGKDLRIELRSRVLLNQVVPFALLVLVMFAFALGPSRQPMIEAAAGVFWVALLFASVLGVQRSSALEAPEGTRDGLRMSGLDPAGVFLGKCAALALQLVVLELLLALGVVLFFGAHVRSAGPMIAACAAGTAGLAAVGTLYGMLASGLRVRETLLPFLLLPVVAPVLLAGTRAWQSSLGTGTIGGSGPWLELLVVFAAVYLVLGVVIYGPLLEAT
ncbi:MAG TPA: heme exporter protein CcmB [Acidimicrobiales bacterium]|nr:heme exporter protein CcmB [Acidimicrobiales bacterium]